MRVIRVGQERPATYRGMKMKANPRLHDEVIRYVEQILPPKSRVLDLGCGEGAFSQRLSDLGFRVEAVDSDSRSFKADREIFTELNLNSERDVSKFIEGRAQCFDLAIGMEVIEHIENPWEFVRTLKSLIRPGGHIIITTPNIESWLSKLKFLFEGKFFHFTDRDFETSGHINPVSGWELVTIARSSGLALKNLEACCSLPVIWLARNRRLLGYSMLNVLIGIFLGPRRKGDILRAHFILEETGASEDPKPKASAAGGGPVSRH